MTVSRSLLLLIAALICLVVAELLETGVLHGSDVLAWAIGGGIAFVASFLPERTP